MKIRKAVVIFEKDKVFCPVGTRVKIVGHGRSYPVKTDKLVKRYRVQNGKHRLRWIWGDEILFEKQQNPK